MSFLGFWTFLRRHLCRKRRDSNVAISLFGKLFVTPSKCWHQVSPSTSPHLSLSVCIGKHFFVSWKVKYLLILHLQTYTDPMKQLIMLEVVDGPSVRFLFNFNILLKLSFILYLPTTINLSADLKTDASTIEKRRTNIFFIVTKIPTSFIVMMR